MDRRRIFDILYASAALHGRDRVLFGESLPFAREAFGRGLCGTAFPELWFELPLRGDPWFDLHMLVSRNEVGEGMTFASLSESYDRVLNWFSTSEDTRQLALSYDTSTGNVQDPATQLLLDDAVMSAAQGFLEAAGQTALCDAYAAFVHAMPKDWYACYLGTFPLRGGGDWVRVECLVKETQHLYAHDAQVLRNHLMQLGLESVDEEFVSQIQELARSPFPLELQFNVGPEGTVLPVLSASVRFCLADWKGSAVADIARLSEQICQWGLSDDRCRELPNTLFAKSIKHEDKVVHIWCYPAFLKLRWRQVQGIDAKAYLMAGAS